MDPTRLREYVEGYDRRKAARLDRRRRTAETARARVPDLAEICRRFGATRVRLFGSLATGFHGETPDIDLAVEGVPPERFFDLWGELGRASPVEVDLIDVDDAPPRLRARVDADGVDV